MLDPVVGGFIMTASVGVLGGFVDDTAFPLIPRFES